MQCRVTITTTSPRTFFITPKETRNPSGRSPPVPPRLAAPNLLSMSVASPLLNISYKWNHTTCGLAGLAPFTERNVFEVHPRGSVCQDVVLFYGPIIFHRTDRPRFAHPFVCQWAFGSSRIFVLNLISQNIASKLYLSWVLNVFFWGGSPLNFAPEAPHPSLGWSGTVSLIRKRV